MVYSERVDGMFCTACAIFCADPSKGVFVSKPFRVWNKKSEKAKEHESCQYHQGAMEQADQFKSIPPLPSVLWWTNVRPSTLGGIAQFYTVAATKVLCGEHMILMRHFGILQELILLGWQQRLQFSTKVTRRLGLHKDITNIVDCSCT